MKNSNAFMAALTATGITILLHSGPAVAGAVVLPFPGPGTSYTSATDGTGFIFSGGVSGLMQTAGDNVDQTFLGTGVASIDSLKVDFNVDNNLNGSSENIIISVNGTAVATFVVPDGGGLNDVTTIAGSIFFAPIVGNGTYDLTMTLQDTIPSDDGSIDFQAGGSFALNGGVRVVEAPEPLTLSLFGAGLGAAFAVSRRRKRSCNPS